MAHFVSAAPDDAALCTGVGAVYQINGAGYFSISGQTIGQKNGRCLDAGWGDLFGHEQFRWQQRLGRDI